jgi:hypothetical protein
MNKNKDTIILIAVIILIFWLLKKFFNFFSTPETEEVTGSSEQDVQVNKANLTYDDIVYNGLADQIQAAVWGGLLAVTEDDEAIFDALNKMENIDDVKRLIQVYCVRGEGIVLQEYYNLPQTITQFLDSDYKEQINAIYLQKGINYQW